MGALDRAENRPRFVQTRHEEMAAFMAAAHGKFTGEVGVCLATSGPRRDSPAQRPLRREDGPRAGAGHRRAVGAHVDGRQLPARGRPSLPLQGRRRRVRPRLQRRRRRSATSSTAPCASPRSSVRRPASSSRRTCRSSMPYEDPPHKHGAIVSSVGVSYAARPSRTIAISRRAAEILNAGRASGDAHRRRRARSRRRRSQAVAEAHRRRRRQGAPRQGRAARRPPVRHRRRSVSSAPSRAGT